MIPSLLIGAAVLAPPVPPSVASAEPAPELNALFRRTDGWLGADGAFSVRVTDQRTLWLFSDTWVGSIRDGKRRPEAMVNNSIGVQVGHGKEAKVTFAIARGKDGKPGTLFVPPDGTGWFWLFAGYSASGRLQVFLPRLEKTGAAGAFGFRGVDLWLGTVANPGDDPTAWQITYAKVPFAEYGQDRTRSWGSAVLRVGDQVYIYGYEEKPGRPFAARRLLVARAPADKLADFDTWQFLGQAGTWTADVKKAVPQIEALGTEFSVHWLSERKQYVLVYTELGLSDRIVGRFASHPHGPWSDAVLLYRCPEMKQNPKVFTYAGKAHPHLATNDTELVLSYAVNSFELAPVINDAELYWPQFVRVRLK